MYELKNSHIYYFFKKKIGSIYGVPFKILKIENSYCPLLKKIMEIY